jgi:uncharacterized protein (DUF2336 family)
MTATASVDLIADLDAAVSGASIERRVLVLRQVTSLLLSNVGLLSEHQLAVFDDVYVRFMPGIETRALVQLSRSLSELTSAPAKAVRCLAYHEDVAVASPVLLRSRVLSDSDLAEIAAACSQPHLLAMSSRRTLGEALTDVLLRRGDAEICRVLAKNAGARFSERGYARLIAAAERNEDIAESLGLRPDLPPAMLREFLAKMTDAVRLQLLAVAPPTVRQKIRAALDHIAAHIGTKMPEPIVYSEAQSRVFALSKIGKLNDSTVNRFAVRQEYTYVVAALSLLSGAAIRAIEPLIEEQDCDGLVVACRASRLSWQTTLSIITHRSVPQLSEEALCQAKEQFEKLYLSTAQQVIRGGAPASSAAPAASAMR